MGAPDADDLAWARDDLGPDATEAEVQAVADRRSDEREADAPVAKRDYADEAEAIKDRYVAALVGIMKAVVGALINAGYDATEPDRMFDDEFRYELATKNQAMEIGEGSYLITTTIEEQPMHEGEGTGLSFSMNITGWGGLIVGGFQPYNYTERVWVDAYDDAAVQERFQEFASADPQGVVDLLDEQD